jgi:hypothetical protein
LQKKIFQPALVVLIAIGFSLNSLVCRAVQGQTFSGKVPFENAAKINGPNVLLDESYGFEIDDYAYDYQGQKNVLKIEALWHYIPNMTKAQYPDVVVIRNDLMQFMNHYPNKMQYWEYLNKDAAQMLMDRYKSMQSIRLKFSIAPNNEEPFARTSIVNLSRH